MQFRVDKTVLKRTLTAAKRIAPAKPSLPILSAVQIESNCESCIRITATDLELVFTAEISAEVIVPGTVCIPVKKLLETVNTLDGELTFVTEDEGRSTATINGLKLDAACSADYPAIPTLAHENSIPMVSRAAWTKALTRVLIAAASPDLRPNYAGVYMEIFPNHANLVACDTYRLALERIENESSTPWPETQLFIPSKLVAEVLKARPTGDTLAIGWDDINRMIRFSMPGLTLSCRQLDAQFPHYEKVLPEPAETPLYLDRESFRAVLKKAQLYPVFENTAIVDLKADETNLHVGIAYADVNDERAEGSFSETLTLKKAAKTASFLEDAKYLLAPLDYLGVTIRLDIVSPKEPIVYREDDYLYLMTPVHRKKPVNDEVERKPATV
jgi:DNA polymerase-3 subunit beta